MMKTENKPELSIIVPVYNVDEYIRDCLNSIKNQTFKNWECILIDDGSTDFSSKICDSYARKDDRFKVIHQKNKGVSAARNVGIDMSAAPLISFIDPDDYISLNFYSELISKMKTENADYAMSFHRVMLDTSTEKCDFIDKYRYKRFCEHPEILINNSTVIKNMRHLFTNGCWGCVYSKKIWGSSHFPENIDLSEDLAIIPQIVAKSDIAVRVSQTTYFYRIRQGSLLHKPLTKKRCIDSLKAGEQMLSECGKYDLEADGLFRTLKNINDVESCFRYLLSNSSKQESRLLRLVTLMQEAERELKEEKTNDYQENGTRKINPGRVQSES